jgi:plastocyanin
MLKSVSRSRPGLAVLGLAVALTLAACSTGPTPTASSAAPATSAPASSAAAKGGAASPATGTAVTIADFAFGPAALTVAVGATVTWTNQDSAGHTVTADDGSFASSKLSNGQTFSQAFAKAGTYAYHCAIHSSMKATIVVQ